MGLFLIESSLKGIVDSKAALDQKAAQLQENLGAQQSALIEIQVSKDFSRSFFIVESADQETATSVVKEAGIPVELVKDVRLVGDDLENVKQNKDLVNYLVEWNLPEDLTMDQYLARKRKIPSTTKKCRKYHLLERTSVRICRNVYASMMRRTKRLSNVHGKQSKRRSTP